MSEATLRIDGHTHPAKPDKNLLDVALGLGYDLPYFCWHPALGSVGACRQCAVIQYDGDDDDRGQLVMACMTAAAEGARFSIEAERARAFRAQVIEWLMANHPHDCPVCDEGGECHLQDMTVMTGHAYRRYRFPKRTHRNQDLGPFLDHEMNRCIQCYRCVRFYDEYAGGRDLAAMAAHDHVYFGRHEDGPLESPFSGNLVEVCPTGVFTDKTLEPHYTRKWDLQAAPSVCTHCCLGCNTTPGERYGRLRRIRARYHGQVNGYFLCDRGRYGYGFVNHERRLRQALAPRGPNERAEVLGGDEAVARLGSWLGAPGGVRGIGSPRASLEANYALQRLVGAERFHLGVPPGEDALLAAVVAHLRQGPRPPSLREVEQCDAVLVLGEDVAATAPMLALALRQAARRAPARRAAGLGIAGWHEHAVREAIQDRTGPLFVAAPAPTALDELARRTVRGAPEELALLGLAVARALAPDAVGEVGVGPELGAQASGIAAALAGAERPLVIAGTSLGSRALVDAAAAVARAVAEGREAGPAELLYVVPECDSLGLALLGGRPLEAAIEAAASHGIETLVVLENDLERRLPPAELDRLLAGTKHLVVLDHTAHATAARAELVLPATTFAEGTGTLVNNEGRAQRFDRVMAPEAPLRESWRWLRDAAIAGGALEDGTWPDRDALIDELTHANDAFAALPDAAPPASVRITGARAPRELHRYSGRTAMHADETVHEPAPPVDPDTPLSSSMEGADRKAQGPLVAEFWAPGWNSIQALNRFQEEIAGPLRGGDGGVRLLEPSDGRARPSAALGAAAANARESADAGEPRSGRPPTGSPTSRVLRVVPLYHVFGSDWLSALTPGVAERAPAPYAALAPATAEALGLEAGADATFAAGDREVTVPVRIVDGLVDGVLGLPEGLAGMPPGPLPRTLEARVHE